MLKKVGNGFITLIGFIIILKYLVGFFGWELNFNVEAVQKVEISQTQLSYFPDSSIEGVLNGFMAEQHEKEWLAKTAKKYNVTPQQLSDSLTINYLQKEDENWTVEVISSISGKGKSSVAKEVKLNLTNYVSRVVQHANKPKH
ncbi:hypothetical protein CWC22_005345 [Pseudoalteromonas rubra]|uniref:Uncharacterized protein n=1 Tax=Pseudoalteromonas rubra TaxID=43658 RepID=A0A5S3UTV9_9GAMM|nr:hypothetical protein [Pseudoalteromonas rubra]QPB82441.1 hypothetical protein CWC22_005345 [Pseudoalteromonas rubra]